MLTPAEGERLLAAALAACRRAAAIHRACFRSAGLGVEAIERKADASPVTQADRGSEEAIREVLRQAAPGFGLLGEEYGQEGDERDRWVIDPLDGTKNFVAGLPWFATLIGLELDGDLVLGAVHAPMLKEGLGETWCAVRGAGAWAGTSADPGTCRERRLRVSGTAALEDAFVQHGGLVYFQRQGLWPAFGEIVARAGRTRGFGDWWGHVLVAEGRCDAMLEGTVSYHDVAAIRPILEEAGGVFLTRTSEPLDRGFHGPTVSSNRKLAPEIAGLLGL
jgi:histidinol-phosphatase